MRRTLWTYLAALAIACVCQLNIAAAQEVQQQAVQDNQVHQTGMFSDALAGPCTSDNCAGDCSTACDDCCEPARCRTVTGMIEIPYLTPHTGSFFLPGTGRITPDFDGQVSSRYSLGVANEEGLGMRMRYWLFDHDSPPATTGGVSVQQAVKAQTLDFETTQTTELCHWQMEWFGGMRYANQEYNLAFSPGGGAVGGLELKFEGVGPTLGMNTLRPIGNGRVSLYGGLRGSLIFGDTRAAGTGAAIGLLGAGIRVDEHVMQIWDLNMGIQYGHGPLFARLGYEAQVWDSGLPIVNFDVGYSGPTVAIGFIR